MTIIPVLDYATFTGATKQEFVDAWGKAARGPGFMVVKNHGVDPDLIAGMFAKADEFFALPGSEKAKISIDKSPHNRGYAGTGSESLDEKSGQMDQKEAFNMALDLPADDPRVIAKEPYRGTNMWPDVPGFKDTFTAYFDQVFNLGVNLHRAIALDLGLPEDHFAEPFVDSMSTLRVLRYPPAINPQPGEIGAGAHTDYGSITLLMSDGTAGLQVKPRDSADWIDVPAVDGAFIVNIGDLLMRWTNDIYVSNPHRVLRPIKERRSIAFFMDPNPNARVEALPGTGEDKHYEPILCHEYLTMRLTATYSQKAAS
ncbi:MAG: 2-oxoglutarate and iron-dependent oxygenase domain-containing protein [Hyphomicrobiales bacterium]|jgi:isopenicillin N synthase-like dioxygenase